MNTQTHHVAGRDLVHMSTEHQRGRRGRPPRPGRARLHALVPRPLIELLDSDAKADGMPMCDKLAEILAAHYSGQVMQRAS